MEADAVTIPASVNTHIAATAALYERIAEGYHRWWAPVIEPAALGSLDRIAPVIAGLPDATILDLGAGTGTLARAAVRRWPTVRTIALDASGTMLDLGRSHAASTLDRSMRRRIEWVAGVAEQLPLEDASIDVVVSSFSLQYFPSRVLALREAHRVLRPGGAIAVVGWLADDREFRPWRLLGEVMKELDIETGPSLEPGVFRSVTSAAALFRRAGFRKVHAAPGIVEHRWDLGPLIRCSLEVNEIADLDEPTRAELERRWVDRLARLPATELLYRASIAYVTAARTGSADATVTEPGAHS